MEIVSVFMLSFNHVEVEWTVEIGIVRPPFSRADIHKIIEVLSIVRHNYPI